MIECFGCLELHALEKSGRLAALEKSAFFGGTPEMPRLPLISATARYHLRYPKHFERPWRVALCF